MRAVGKVAGAEFVNTTLRGSVQETALEGLNPATDVNELITRVVFGGVPSLEEAKEATSDLKDALDKVYLSSPNYRGTTQVHAVSSVSNLEVTKDCGAYRFEVTQIQKHAMHAFKLLNESPSVQALRKNYFNENLVLVECGISMGSQLTEVDGRILVIPRL